MGPRANMGAYVWRTVANPLDNNPVKNQCGDRPSGPIKASQAASLFHVLTTPPGGTLSGNPPTELTPDSCCLDAVGEDKCRAVFV